jgi:hypothetical protein
MSQEIQYKPFYKEEDRGNEHVVYNHQKTAVGEVINDEI